MAAFATMREGQCDIFAESFSGSRRPSVARASSLPNSGASPASTMFVSNSTDGSNRPPLPRASSDSNAAGVLERRRRKAISENGAAPLHLVLDFKGMSTNVVLADLALMKAARRAAAEPREWDWGYASATNSAAAGPSNYFTSSARSHKRPEQANDDFRERDMLLRSRARLFREDRARSANADGLVERTSSYSVDCEWDWALGGRCRVPAELYCDRQSVPRRITRAYLPKQEVEAGRRNRPDPGEHRADGLLLESQLAQMAPELSARLQHGDDPRFSRSRQHGSGAGRPRLSHQHKASLQILTTVGPTSFDDGDDRTATPGWAKPCSPFEGAREHALSFSRSRSVERSRTSR